jgi:hypothetical protein
MPFCYTTQKLKIILIYLILDLCFAWGNYKYCIDERILIKLLFRGSWNYIRELKISLHFYFIYNFKAYNGIITYRSAVQRWDALVSTATNLGAGWSGVRISAGAKYFSFVQKSSRFGYPPGLLFSGEKSYLWGGKADGTWCWLLTVA